MDASIPIAVPHWHFIEQGWNLKELVCQMVLNQEGSDGFSFPLDCILNSNFHILCFMQMLITEMKAHFPLIIQS